MEGLKGSHDPLDDLCVFLGSGTSSTVVASHSELPTEVMDRALNWTMDQSDDVSLCPGMIPPGNYKCFSSTPKLTPEVTPSLAYFGAKPKEPRIPRLVSTRQDIIGTSQTDSPYRVPEHSSGISNIAQPQLHSCAAVPFDEYGHRSEERQARQRDVEAIRDTCTYIEDVVTNLNARMNSLDPDARQRICALKLKLASVCSRNSDCERRDSTSSQSSQEQVQIRSSTPGKKVKFEYPTFQASTPDLKFDRNPSNQTMYGQDVILQALSRLDNRTVPKPEVFSTSTGQSFPRFLELFQEYCQNNFRGSSSLWIAELGRLLEGDIKFAFDALRAPGDTYESVRDKLIKWIQDRTDLLKGDTKNKFFGATNISGESTSLYAARLEKLFRLAYPQRSVETSASLRNKYLDTVPESFRLELQTALNLTKSMTSKQMPWSQIMFHACQFDAHNKKRMEHNVNYVDQDDRCCIPHQEVWVATKRDNEDVTNTRSSRDTRRGPNRSQARDRTGPSLTRACYHCHKPGHLKRDCRKLNNRCFICGSPTHRIADCPDRRVSRSRDNRSRDPSEHSLNAEATAFHPADSGSLSRAYRNLLATRPSNEPEN